MRFCGKCGAQCEDNTKFCPKCGNALNPVNQGAQAPNYSYNTDNAGNTYYSNAGRKTEPTSGMAIASLVLGIVGIITGAIAVVLSPLCGMGVAFLLLLPSLIAAILGVLVILKHEKKGLAIAGLILGALFFFIYLIFAIKGAHYYSLYHNTIRSMEGLIEGYLN